MEQVDKKTPRYTFWTRQEVYDSLTHRTLVCNYATCPTCQQFPIYGEDECPVCGQALILPDICTGPLEKISHGYRDESENLVCECGCRDMRLDGWYEKPPRLEYVYKCKNGHYIHVTHSSRKINYIV